MIIFKTPEVMSIAAQNLPSSPVIIEAGAYNGSDTLRMIQQWPNATIHAFEPIPELFEALKEKTANYPTISCYPYALSNQTGTAPFHVSERPEKPGIPSQAGSLLTPKERLNHSPLHFPKTISVPTITLDDWAKKYHIDRVDFLWLDMQGAELSVLKASEKIRTTVQLIFTEVSFIESYQGIPQEQEITGWLTAHGFELVGQDYKNHTDHFFGNRLFKKE